MAAGSEQLLDAMTEVSRHLLRLMTQCLDQLPEGDEVSASQYRALASLVQRGPRNAVIFGPTFFAGRGLGFGFGFGAGVGVGVGNSGAR